MHWNLGSRHWEQKRDEIQLLVDQHGPDFLYISEANLFNGTPDHETHIEGYNLTRAKTTEILGYSRIVLLSKSGINFKLENDRMDDDISSIWIKLGGRGRKSLLIGSIYREHFLIKQGEPNISRNQDQQEYRWDKFIKQWVNASRNGPCLVVGDVNLDQLKWNNPDGGHENMVEQTIEEIMSRNFTQFIHEPTRFWPGTNPSLIDQCWGNLPDRVSNPKNFTRGTGDHNVIGITYRMIGNIKSKMEVKGRDMKKKILMRSSVEESN